MYYLGNGPSLYESVGNLTEFYPSIEENEEETAAPLLSIPFVAMFVVPKAKRFLSKKL